MIPEREEYKVSARVGQTLGLGRVSGPWCQEEPAGVPECRQSWESGDTEAAGLTGLKREGRESNTEK